MFPVALKVSLNMRAKSVSSHRSRAKEDYHSQGHDGGNTLQDLFDKDSPRQTRRSSTSRIQRGRVSRSTSPSEKSSSTNRCFVNHSYHDHSHEPEDETKNAFPDEDSNKKDSQHVRGGPRGGVSTPFPEKLYEMLSKAESEMFDTIVSWHPHGRSFAVHEPKRFVAEIMPQFFKQSKLTSFQRQLNLYGFSRLTAGPDRGGYYHELFLRGRFHLCKRMIRTRVKGTGVKAAASPSTEPNFYDMEPCLDESDKANQEMTIQCLPVVKSSANLHSDSSISLWMLPTMVSEETRSDDYYCSSAVQDDDAESLPPTAVKELPDRMQSAPWSPQAVISELEASVEAIGKYQPNRCLSPMEELFNGDLDDCANVMVCHSGDEVVFEGQRFHYLDTDFFLKETGSSGLRPSSEVSCLDDCMSSFVDWQVDETQGELSIYA